MIVARFLTKELEKILSKYPSTGCLLFPYYKDLVKKEIEIANITNKDRVLCVGGGSYPCTAVIIARETGALVEVIDIDPIAVENSKKVVKNLKLKDQVKIFQESGQRVNPEGFTVIHIARQAQPHEKIIQNMLRRSSQGARILVRNPGKSLNKIYRMLHKSCYFNNYCYCEENYDRIKATLLYIKNLGGKKNEEINPISDRDIIGNPSFLAG